MVDYSNYKVLSSIQSENIIVLKLIFSDNEIVIIEPEVWPTNLDEFCLDQVKRLKDPNYFHFTINEPGVEESI